MSTHWNFENARIMTEEDLRPMWHKLASSSHYIAWGIARYSKNGYKGMTEEDVPYVAGYLRHILTKGQDLITEDEATEIAKMYIGARAWSE